MKKIKEIIVFSGIWIIPATIIIGESFKTHFPSIPVHYGLEQEVLLGLIIVIFVLAANGLTLENGKPLKAYHLFDAFNLKRDLYAQRHKPHSEIYPPVPDCMKFNKPTGLVLGKSSGKYICDRLDSGSGHYLILGQSGCGKTVTLLSTLINNQRTKEFTIFAIDVKGELHKKGTLATDASIIIIDPDDFNAWGYDPLYKIGSTFTEQELIEVASEISYSLIPIISDEKNAFWTDNARSLLMACIIYYYKQGYRDLINVFDVISESSIEEVIDDITSGSATDSAEYRTISRFIGMADETLSGIVGQMFSSLTVFLQDEKIRYMLSGNNKKAAPTMLNSGRSIYLAIPEHKISDYARVLHLIINQVISEMETRPEGLKRVLMVIDELPRILSAGRIEKLENALETLRSRCVSMVLITQSTDALERAYSHATVQGMVVNVNKMILSASSRDTVDNIIRWAGKYMGIRYTQSRSYRGGNSSVSYEQKNRIEPSELITLPLKNECIIITNNGYNRFKKIKYYEDKNLKKTYAELQKSWNELKS